MPFAAIVTRLVGLWILTGAVLKTFYGSPADLPQVVQDLPLAIGTTFKLMIGIESIVGLGVLLRPSRGWLPALLLLLVFAGVLVMQVADGASSCGCFGAALVIAPGVMLAIDGTLALLLLLSKPWRLAPGKREAPWAAVAVVAIASLALPLFVDREAQPGGPGWAYLKIDEMLGQTFADTPLYAWLTEEQRIDDGIVVIWRGSCEVCRDHLGELADKEYLDEEPDILLLELPKEFEDEKSVVDRLPTGAWVQEAKLPDTVIWVDVTPPTHIEVAQGKVTKVLVGMDVYD